MAAALAIFPVSGSVTAKVSVCKINVTGADTNDASTFDADNSPSMDEMRYRIIASCAGVDNLVSHEFNVNGGKHQWDNLIFPESGSWTVDLVDLSDDGVAATLAVTVA